MRIVSFRSPWPDQWTDEEKAEYKRAYLAGEDHVVPNPEHDGPESCNICAALRALRAEADEESA